MYTDDIISAISTPYGRGGIAVIRVSGNRVCEALSPIIRMKKNITLTTAEARRAYNADILSDGEVIDHALVTVFRAPFSFTGEDTVEIACHGGILLAETVLSETLACGARVARAGEFTQRAFLSGKITLSQAEAVIDAIDAETKDKLILSSAVSKGVLSDEIGELYNRTMDVISEIAVTCDYPDEDLSDMSRDDIKTALTELSARAERLKSSYCTGRAVSEGIPAVICGKPNTGKSSLLNMLLGRERAIVTSIEGTTRDTIEETVSLGRVLLRLCDTAGLRDTGDEIEAIGVERSLQKIDSAELVLAVFDLSRKADESDAELVRRIGGKNAIAILNKDDTQKVEFDISAVESIKNRVYISAKNLRGKEEIISAVEKMYIDRELDIGKSAIITNARQYAAVKTACEAFHRALIAQDDGMPPDAVMLDTEQAASALGELDGRQINEETVSRIFSRFCVGK